MKNTIGKKIHRIICIFAAVFALFLLHACQSKQTEVQDITEYHSMNLRIHMQYPASWYIFESSEGIRFAPERRILISTQQEQLVNAGDFVVFVSVIDSLAMQSFVEILKKRYIY